MTIVDGICGADLLPPTGHGILTICPTAKSGDQRSAISHKSVAHK